jgi:outer membrane protein TolC
MPSEAPAVPTLYTDIKKPDLSAVQLDETLSEPGWEPSFDPELGLRLWDCILLALENNRPLRNAREDLRIAGITLTERREEFGNIYTLGAAGHYDENGPLSPIASSQGGLDRDRFSFSFGGLETDGSFLTRQFPGGGRLSLGAISYYNSQTATRLRPFMQDGELMFEPYLRDVRWFSEANLVITQPLLEGAGGVATTGLRIQELQKTADSLRLEREIQFLINSVVRDYLSVQLDISLINVLEQAYDAAVEQYKRTVVRDVSYIENKELLEEVEVEGGKPGGVDPIELVRAEQQITANKQRLINAKNDVETSLIDLRLTLGLEPDRAIVLSGTEIPEVLPPGLDLHQAIGYGLKHRPEYRITEIVKNQAQLNQAFAENALLPNLDLNWRMAFREQDDDFLESWEVLEYQDAGADIRLALPLNLPSDKANYQRSLVRVRQAQNDLEQQYRIITNEVDTAYRAQETLLERITVLRRNEELARETYEKLLGLYDFGRVPDPFDVTQAQDDWTAAAADRVQAEINYVIASSLLDFTMGIPISELMARYAPSEPSAAGPVPVPPSGIPPR